MKYLTSFYSAYVGHLSACKTPGRESLASSEYPNILFLLADDLGYWDLSCFGRSDIETPNLDAPADGGQIRFRRRFLRYRAGDTPISRLNTLVK